MRGVVVENGRMSLLDDLTVRDPQSHEVRIRVLASGLCASDLLLLKHPVPTPTMMGHEGAGVVVEVGSEVTSIAVGDTVAVTCQRPCLACEACRAQRYSACPTALTDPSTPFSRGAQPVKSFARSSSLAAEIVVDELQAHRITKSEPHAAALIGCAVSTGYGMVRNVAELQTGQSLAVIGVGGIGINSIQTARLQGASQIVAVDIDADKAAIARQFGADVFVHVDPRSSAEEVARQIVAAAGSAVDAVVEATGQPSAIHAAVSALAPGGRLALVGIPSPPLVEFDVAELMLRHITISAALNGACDPFADMASIVALAEAGRLDLSSQVSHRFPLSQIHDAVAALESGRALRVVVDVADDS